MKKRIIPFLVAGMLSATSCTELFEPSVDYGDQTYINDYSALVSAVNDLNKTLGERFDALNKLLEKEMANIALSIDENTGAIKVMNSSLTEGLGTINTTLFNGFNALNTTIDKNGDKIVYAMNDNGELLRLQIDSTGKLISAEIKASTAELVKVINSQTATLAEKLAALTTITEAGLADISVKIEGVDKTLKLELGNVNANLGTLNTTMLDGFTALNTTLNENGAKIVTAINKNGEIISLQIDATGKLIQAELKQLATDLIATINDQTKTLKERLDAMSDVINSGLADVKLSIDNQTKSLNITLTNIDDKLGTINASLGTINTTMLNGFTALTAEVKLQGESTVIAINAQKEAIIASIDKNGNLLNAQLVNLNTNQTNINTNLGKLLDAFSEFKTQNNTNLAAINQTIAALNPTLEGLGIKLTTVIDNQGEIITAITTLGNDIAGSITEQTTALNQAIANNSASIVSSNNAIKDAINTQIAALKTSTDANAATQIEILNKMLADDGVYQDGNSFYMTPEIWASVEAAGSTSSVYQAFANQLTATYPSITTVQVTPTTPWHTCAVFTKTSEAASLLVGGNMQPMTLANGKTVIRVIKTPGTIYYQVTASGCAYPTIYKVTACDAMSTQPGTIDNARTEWTGSSTTVTNVKLYTYYNGTIVTSINTWAYCQ